MKASIILSLPVLAIAAATPQMEERQVQSPLNPACLLKIAGIKQCIPSLSLDSIVGLADIVGCPVAILADILKCAVKLPVPVPK
ncbi:hypothetical protein IL306_010458 [Fusarium sp. DS 682]|nr:hypothetical protein IL306_010458 [Fusarium sp. DS 682]